MRLAWERGQSVRSVVSEEGIDGLEWWMAYLQAFEPHLADDRRAAKLAFFAGNQFAKPIQFPTMAANFGVPVEQGAPAATSLDDVPSMLESLGHSMPEHIRERFQ